MTTYANVLSQRAHTWPGSTTTGEPTPPEAAADGPTAGQFEPEPAIFFPPTPFAVRHSHHATSVRHEGEPTSSPAPHLTSSATEPVMASSSTSSPLLAALTSGSFLAVVFNPYDRALYLRVHSRTHFLDHRNWAHPFQGFSNAALYRTLSSATYFYWQAVFTEAIQRREEAARAELSERQRRFLVGSAAGTMNGVLLNPLQLVKFRMWAAGRGASFRSEYRHLRQKAGPSVFLRGSLPSVCRDIAFGVVYELTRSTALPHHVALDAESGTDGQASSRLRCRRLAMDCVAGMVASTVSSPFNYVRNQVYSAPVLGCPLGMSQMLSFLVREAVQQPTMAGGMRHLNSRLNLGWGTARVGVGMAVGQLVFEWAKERT